MFILEELLSPVVTPIILIFCLRRKSLEIIDFFRNFTVEVVGVGDTCSFAQMDIRQHGHPAVRLSLTDVRSDLNPSCGTNGRLNGVWSLLRSGCRRGRLRRPSTSRQRMGKLSYRWCTLPSQTRTGSLLERPHISSASWKKESTRRLQGPPLKHIRSPCQSLK